VIPLIVIDAAAPEAEAVYRAARGRGASIAVHGDAPWAEPEDRLDVGAAAFLALYADRVVGDGLPAVLQ
jgi:hypothetical protein